MSIEMLKLNLDDKSWETLSRKDFAQNSKRYLQQSRFEQDYYQHIQQLKSFGWSFFTPRPKSINSPNVTFLMWDISRITIETICKRYVALDRLKILNSYVRNQKIETVINLKKF